MLIGVNMFWQLRRQIMVVSVKDLKKFNQLKFRPAKTFAEQANKTRKISMIAAIGAPFLYSVFCGLNNL